MGKQPRSAVEKFYISGPPKSSEFRIQKSIQSVAFLAQRLREILHSSTQTNEGVMRKFDKVMLGVSTLALTALTAAPAMAGSIIVHRMPAPGVMGLVAAGVIAAIAVARLRK
jgi:hypothetical protein